MNKEINTKIGVKKEVKRFAEFCPICTLYVKKEDFKTRTSLKEYEISGICQRCQDNVFSV